MTRSLDGSADGTTARLRRRRHRRGRRDGAGLPVGQRRTPNSSASPRPRATSPSTRSASTTSGCSTLCGVGDVPVSEGRRTPAGDAAAHRRGHPRPRGARLRPTARRATGGSPTTTRPRPGCGPRTRIPGRADRAGHRTADQPGAGACAWSRPCPGCCGGWSSWAARSTTAATPPRWPSGTSASTPRRLPRCSPCGARRGGSDEPTHLPIVLGLNLTENVAMTPAILSRLAAAAGSATTPMSVLDDRGTRSAAANPLIRVLEDAMRFYFEFHFDQGEGYLAHLHDPLAAAVALDPDLVQLPAGDRRRRTDGHPDPRHDRGRLAWPLGPTPQRAHRRRGRPGRVLRPVHRAGGPVRARLTES